MHGKMKALCVRGDAAGDAAATVAQQQRAGPPGTSPIASGTTRAATCTARTACDPAARGSGAAASLQLKWHACMRTRRPARWQTARHAHLRPGVDGACVLGGRTLQQAVGEGTGKPIWQPKRCLWRCGREQGRRQCQCCMHACSWCPSAVPEALRARGGVRRLRTTAPAGLPHAERGAAPRTIIIISRPKPSALVGACACAGRQAQQHGHGRRPSQDSRGACCAWCAAAR